MTSAVCNQIVRSPTAYQSSEDDSSALAEFPVVVSPSTPEVDTSLLMANTTLSFLTPLPVVPEVAPTSVKPKKRNPSLLIHFHLLGKIFFKSR